MKLTDHGFHRFMERVETRYYKTIINRINKLDKKGYLVEPKNGIVAFFSNKYGKETIYKQFKDHVYVIRDGTLITVLDFDKDQFQYIK